MIKEFGKNIKFLRIKSGLTQSEISTATGLNRTTWNNYESGVSQPNIEGLISLSNYFDVSETDLLHTDLSNAHLMPKSDGSKNQEKAHLNSHLSAHPITKKEEEKIKTAAQKQEFKWALNDDQMPYKLEDRVLYLINKVGALEAILHQKTSVIEARLNELTKTKSKK